jgi:hypothetical protein
MKSRWFALSMVALFFASFAAALDHHAGDGKKAGDDKKAAQHQAMMEAWMKAATPGDAHKALEPFVGTWDVKVKSWMEPGAEPMESAGTSENRWVLDGRWVEQQFKGTFMDMPFNGIGYTGYDNMKKQYVGTWMDNMSTAAMLSTGTGDANVWKFTSTMDDPVTGKATPVKETITVTDKDNHLLEMWSPAPDGSMFKTMEIRYTRKK